MATGSRKSQRESQSRPPRKPAVNRLKKRKENARFEELRLKAESKLKDMEKNLAMVPDDGLQQLLHELEVHQIELEMQNEELRIAQEELEESRRKYSNLYDFAPVGYFIFDNQGIVTEVNLTGAQQLGIERRSLTGSPFVGFVKGDRQSFYAHLKEVLETGTRKTCEIELRKRDGTAFHARLESIAVRDSNGGDNRCRTALTDITETKLAEQALRGSESKYHSLFANMTNGFAYHQIVLNEKGHPIDCIFLDVNEAFEKMVGLEREQIIGRKVTEILPGLEKDDFDWIGEFGSVALTGKEIRFETYGRLHKRWYSVSAYSPRKGYFGAIFEDVTERKKTQEELRKQREDLDRAQTIGHIGSWRIDVARNELAWSGETHLIFGIPEGMPLTYETFLSVVHPEDRSYVDEKWSAALRGEPYDIEHRIVVKGETKWVREIAELEVNKNGDLLGGFGTTQDITPRKQTEEELHKVTEELKRSNADLEQFAYIASHDLQSPLRNVEGFVKLLARRYKGKLDDRADEFIAYISTGVKDMQMLIKDILEYSRVGSGKKFKKVDTSLCVAHALANLQAEIDEKGAVITQDERLPTILGDSAQLTVLFQNLIENAIKFCKETPAINISAKKEDQKYIFSMQDNGIGIDTEYIEKVFDVFQRLHSKAAYPGTGIGLAICQKIVERHGGQIWAESEPGKGSTFFFTLPTGK